MLTAVGELMKELIDVYTESENKFKLFMTELQASEKKWKTLVENNEKILAERTQEKTDLLTQMGELEMKLDKIQREVRTKENEIKSIKNMQAIEIANIKHLNEALLKEKLLIIEEQNKSIESLSGKVTDFESENQKLQSEHFKTVTQLQNQEKILIDESKKKPKNSQQQNAFTTLFKNIKTNLDEFKTLLAEVDEVGKLKKQIVDLQREVSEKEFSANKKVLDIRKELGGQITELKLKHENETRILESEIETLKQNSENCQEKLSQAENKLKALLSKFEALQTEKVLLEENVKIKENIILQYSNNIEKEKIKATEESNIRQDIEMELSKTKVDRAIIQEDSEVLVDFITDIAIKYAKKKLSIKDTVEKLRNDKLKTTLLERLSQNEIKHDI